MSSGLYLHIPKTAGTALKFLLKSGFNFFKVAQTHQETLKQHTNVLFGVRDPWERFCSGFWEIKTLPLRHELSLKIDDDVPYELGSFKKLQDSYPDWYKNIISLCSTPDDFCSMLKTDRDLQEKLYSFDNGATYKKHTPLGIVTQSLSWWLGNLEEYKQNEHRILTAINVKSLGRFVSNYYEIQMPTDPFRSRSRKQFDFEQSYSISDQNLDWFKNDFRRVDYELVNYIKQRPYYYEK